MTFPDAEQTALAAARLRDAIPARWAELFSERRCTLRILTGTCRDTESTESWDLGAGARAVLADGGILHASSTGDPGRAAGTAARSLIERRAGSNTGTPEPESAGDGGATAELVGWLEAQSRMVLPALEVFLEGLGGGARGGFEAEIEAIVSIQRIAHVSTDTPRRSDTRTGVLLDVRLSGPGASVRRRWAAEDARALLSRGDLSAAAARMVEAHGLIADAAPAPTGEFPVVFAPGGAGVLLHEAVGHLLEADVASSVGTRLSSSAGGRGRGASASQVLSERLTVVDDPVSLKGRNSYRVDDEGTPAGRSVLVERGRIVGQIGDRWNGGHSTGHGRRQSHRDPPLPRLAATFCEGEDDPEGIVRDTTRGVYVDQVRRGFIDAASGAFVLHAAEGRLIEGGRLTAGVRDLILTGEAVRTLSRVDRVGRDLAGDGGATSCVRSGQAVTSIVGAPTLRITGIMVGGMADE